MEDQKRAFLISQTYATLFSVTNKVQSFGDRSLDELTSRQLMALIAIVHIPEGEVTLNRIALKLGTTKQSTAQIIGNLKKRGLLQTEKSTMDGRATNIFITEAGKEVFIRSNTQGWGLLNELFHEFSLDELEIFWKMLKKLYVFDGEGQDGFEEDSRDF